MSAVLTPPVPPLPEVVPQLASVEKPQEQPNHIVLSGISWDGYEKIGEALRDRSGIHLTYDRGVLEIMTLSRKHEWNKSLLAQLVEMLTFELEIDRTSGGGMTFKREDQERGMEPDESYWIQHEAQMRGKEEYDITSDPTPDLVIETEISRSVLDRLAILAALKVPEVWRYDGIKVQVLLLAADGQYVPSERSRAFPFLPIMELERFLALRMTLSETKLLRQFRDWVRQQRTAWGV